MLKESYIREYLYLGSIHDVERSPNRFDAVVSITSDNVECGGNKLHLRLEDADDTDIYPFLDVVSDFIHIHIQQELHVLVHCGSGMSRSPAFVMAYLVKYHGQTVDDSLKYISSRRNIICPKPHFVDSIRRWSAATHKDNP